MEKLGRLVRKGIEDQIRKNLKEVDSVLVVGYSGLSGPVMNNLRQSLRKSKSNLLVIKNSISKKVFTEIGLAEFSKMLQGPCGLVFIKDEIIAASKVLYKFVKENQTFKIEGGILKNRILTKSDISNLASLPSKEALYAKVVGSLKSPIYSLVGVLNNTLKKFVIVLDGIRKKRGTIV